MNQYDINRNLKDLFENGQLPTMVYMLRQHFNTRKIERPIHGHDSITEIVIVNEGTGIYKINDKVYELQAGDIAFYNQNDLHEVSSSRDGAIGTYTLGITNLYLKGMEKNHFIKAGTEYVRDSGALFPLIQGMCEQIYKCDEIGLESTSVPQLLCATVIALSLQIQNFKGVSLGKTKDEVFVRNILSYLNDNYTDPVLNLESIANTFDCSVSYVSHTVKKITGNTPIQYLIKRRMGLAKSLLISTEMTATNIANIVGYDNTNYFTTLFTKVVGMTPIEYRKYYEEKLCDNAKKA